jgi:hypothetical protein
MFCSYEEYLFQTLSGLQALLSLGSACPDTSGGYAALNPLLCLRHWKLISRDDFYCLDSIF